MTTPNGPGLIEIPGMKGTIQINYDLQRGGVNIQPCELALPQLITFLLLATQGAVNEWARRSAGLIGTGERNSSDGSEEKSSTEENDDDDDR